LGILDAPGGAAVLALHPDRMHPLFDAMPLTLASLQFSAI
jgi:hypothetical protein